MMQQLQELALISSKELITKFRVEMHVSTLFFSVFNLLINRML